MKALKLAKQSFGLIVPDSLVDMTPFNLLDLEEDALVRVHSVDEDGTVNVQDSSWTIVPLSPEELSALEDVLEDKWVKLVPTVTHQTTELNQEAWDKLQNAVTDPKPANQALKDLLSKEV